MVVVVCGWDGGETVGSLPNTRLTGATVDCFETVGNGRFLRKPFFASASQTRTKGAETILRERGLWLLNGWRFDGFKFQLECSKNR